MKNTFKYLASSVLFFTILNSSVHAAPAIESNAQTAAPSGENWKGTTHVLPFEAGVMTGAALYGSHLNWTLLGTGAYLLKDKAFVPDIDDRIWAELKMGPTFFTTNGNESTGLQYQANLRWDFTLNETWTFYALGGIAGYSLPRSYGDGFGGYFTLHPNTGVGAEYQTKAALMLRAEISSDFMGFGVAFNF